MADNDYFIFQTQGSHKVYCAFFDLAVIELSVQHHHHVNIGIGQFPFAARERAVEVHGFQLIAEDFDQSPFEFAQDFFDLVGHEISRFVVLA